MRASPLLLALAATLGAGDALAAVAKLSSWSTLMTQNPSLRRAVAAEMTALTPKTAASAIRNIDFEADAPAEQARAVALALLADEAGKTGQIAELLGPQAGQAASALALEASQLAEIRDAAPQDEEESARLNARLDRMFDAAEPLDALQTGVPVMADRETAVRTFLKAAPKFGDMTVRLKMKFADNDARAAKMVMERGSLDGVPAMRLTRPDGSGYMVLFIGRDVGPDQAAAMVAAIKRPGPWRMPDDEDAVMVRYFLKQARFPDDAETLKGRVVMAVTDLPRAALRPAGAALN